MNILISDGIAEAGIEMLRQYAQVDVLTKLSPQELESIITNYDALIVRSQTKVTKNIICAARKLQVIGRVGVGIDNIDMDAATRQGIFVVNSPEGNIVSTAEHTIALLLSAVRNIPKAHNQLHLGVWDRNIRGVQVRSKVLGIIGLGKVGTEVAGLAKGLRMRVIAYDPMISENRAAELGVEMTELDTLLSISDFITIHVPLNSTTKGLIGKRELNLMKDKAIIINCARGGIIDELELYQALSAGRIMGAAIDVFSEEPALNNILLKSDKVITTPHLAASTIEATTSTSIDIAEQVIAILSGNPAVSPVNMPVVSKEEMGAIRPYLDVGITLSRIGIQLIEGQLESLTVIYQGDIVKSNTQPIKAAILTGLLELLTDERVNAVNADLIADNRGIKVVEKRDAKSENYANMLTIDLETKSGNVLVSGSSIRGATHLLRVKDYWLEFEPTRYMVFTEHEDRPGMIGKLGTIIGDADINISQMQVSRGVQRGGGAMMAVCIDKPLTPDCYEMIKAIPHMYKVNRVKLMK